MWLVCAFKDLLHVFVAVNLGLNISFNDLPALHTHKKSANAYTFVLAFS